MDKELLRADSFYVKAFMDQYDVVLLVNMKTGRFNMVKFMPDLVSLGFNHKEDDDISKLTDAYEQSGFFHKDDVKFIHEATSFEKIAKDLKEGRKPGAFKYRHKQGDEYQYKIFQVIVPSDYSDKKPYVLYTWQDAEEIYVSSDISEYYTWKNTI